MIYVVDADNLDNLVLEYVAATKVLPRVKLDGSRKMEFSVMVRDKTKSELKADLQATKQADSRGYQRTFGDLKATTLSKARMGERLAASGVSTEKVARNGTRPAITFIANPTPTHTTVSWSRAACPKLPKPSVRRTLDKPSATSC